MDADTARQRAVDLIRQNDPANKKIFPTTVGQRPDGTPMTTEEYQRSEIGEPFDFVDKELVKLNPTQWQIAHFYFGIAHDSKIWREKRLKDGKTRTPEQIAFVFGWLRNCETEADKKKAAIRVQQELVTTTLKLWTALKPITLRKCAFFWFKKRRKGKRALMRYLRKIDREARRGNIKIQRLEELGLESEEAKEQC